MSELMLNTDFVDNYILKAKPEYVMVYLYTYRQRSENKAFTIEDIKNSLNISQEIVVNAIEYWTSMGFDIFTPKRVLKSDGKAKYSHGEIARLSENNRELALLYEEAERIMEKPLSAGDMQTIFWIYKDLGLEGGAIILLFNYAKAIKKCRIRSVEKLAMEWSDNGIKTIESAERHLKEIEKEVNYQERVKKLYDINEDLTQGEKNMIKKWQKEYKPTKNQLMQAYEITLSRTNGFSVKYVHGILKNWHSNPNPKLNGSVPTPKATKFNNFESKGNIDYKKLELEALKKRINRIKEGEK